MVEFGSGPVKETIDNTVFIIPGIIVVLLVGNFDKLKHKKRASSLSVNNILYGGRLSVNGQFDTIAIEGFFSYKLVSSLREKQRLKEEKKKLKQQRKEKDIKKKK